MTNLTDEQRLSWPDPKTGTVSVQQELEAIIANSSRALAGLINDQRDPALQDWLIEEISAAKTALDAITKKD